MPIAYDTNQLAYEVGDKYYDSLLYKDMSHSKLLILFSGVPGSGKSTIAKGIERQLMAVRISNDEIRDRIIAFAPRITPTAREQVKFRVVTRLLHCLASVQNGLIVVDASCDRGYDYYVTWAADKGYPILLVRVEIPRSVIERRLMQRDDRDYRDASSSSTTLDKWWKEWEELGRTHEVSLRVTERTPLEETLRVIKEYYDRACLSPLH